MSFLLLIILTSIDLVFSNGFFYIFSPNLVQVVDPQKATVIITSHDPRFPPVWASPSVVTSKRSVLIYANAQDHFVVIDALSGEVLASESRVLEGSQSTPTTSTAHSLSASGGSWVITPWHDPSHRSNNLTKSLLLVDVRTGHEQFVSLNARGDETGVYIQHILYIPRPSPKPAYYFHRDSVSGAAPYSVWVPPHNTDCVECTDREPKPYCKEPGRCGYDPILRCEKCIDGISTPGCPYPGACGFLPTDKCHYCRSRQSTSGCPVPERCGFAPVPKCIDCVSGISMPECPYPQFCNTAHTPPPNCADCKNRLSQSPNCPDPGLCGMVRAANASECIDCMPGMAMPQCPDPDACGVFGCSMASTFGLSSDVCVLFDQWEVTTGAQYFGTVIAVLVMCAIREWLSAYRQKRAIANARTQAKVDTQFYATEAAWYCASLFMSYILMLIIMTYEYVLFLVIVFGSGLCHFLFHYYFYYQQQSLPNKSLDS